MLKRTIEVSTEGTRLSLRGGQLVIAREGEILATVPFEDLGYLLVDSHGVELSSGALRAAAASGTAVLICGENHTPCGLYLPLEGNSLHAERLRAQIIAPMPLKKQLWARIVTAKILMQAALLNEGDTARARLETLAAEVQSGDSQNREAQAARIYWAELFAGIVLPEPFHREPNGPPPNGLLNYGYAIVRAAVARALCLSGLHPALGVHHENRGNAFALADDLMEPFRPIVDARVRELARKGLFEVNKDSKRMLLEVLTEKVCVGKSGPCMNGVQRAANSLAACFMEAANTGETGRAPAPKMAKMLELPEP